MTNTTFSTLQISQLKNSWSTLAQDPSQLASTLVLRLFKENPEYQSLFKRLKNISIQELPSNSQFKGHASKVGAALGTTVDHLDKPKELEEILKNVGIKHKKYGLTSKHFQVIGDVLVSIIAEKIGDSEPELINLWKSCLTSVISIIATACCY